MKRRKKMIWWSLGILLFLFLVRIFLYQTVPVKGFEMGSTLVPGDRVIVNKVRAGWRLPHSIFKVSDYRFPAIKPLKRGEVIAFNRPQGFDQPIDRKPIFISRIAGFPGDTVLVWDKQVYINRVIVDPPGLARTEYRVVVGSGEITSAFLRRHSVEKPRLIDDIGIYDVDLDPRAREAMDQEQGISTIRPTKQFAGDSSIDYYPPSNFFLWNRDQFGPLIVPRKGQTVDVAINTVDLYREIIENHEGNQLQVDWSGVKMNGRPIDKYTFKKDYYFVLDDNRDHPNDSRIIGYIPADHIIGVVNRIACSHQGRYDYLRKIRIDRTFKRVR
ncbi:MAG: signal peptidase I [Bacteroidales bacterium]